MTASDATRLAGDAYRTRLAHGEPTISEDKTRLAQEGYQPKLARDAAVGQSDTSEYYKIGEKIGDRYEVAAIHHGAMGVVYGCLDHETNLPRALKTVRARYASDKNVLSLFEREAAVWISLEKHPYIVRAYLVMHFGDLPYVITEYISGPENMERDLRGWLGHPRLTLPIAIGMALQIAQGMQHAVRMVPDFIHRDLKPANILVNDSAKAMVTDFGLVNSAQADAGTPAYMAPEQWREDALDIRSDIYAYGCILFEMFTAHRLFPASTEHDWKHAHLEAAPVSLINFVPKLPFEIDRFVRLCLSKDKNSRPANWTEVVTFLGHWYHRLTGKAVISDFSSLSLDSDELTDAAYSLFRLKCYSESFFACERALAIDTNNVAAWVLKGNIECTEDNYEEAILAFDSALAHAPNDERIWYFKGSALDALKRFDEANSAYDRVLLIEPMHAGAWARKGSILCFGEKRYENAISAYDIALQIDPHYAIAWSGKASAFLMLRRYEDALHAYEQATSIDPNDSYYWRQKGYVLCQLKRREEGFESYIHALKLGPDDPANWVSNARILVGQKRYEEAFSAYKKATSLSPDDPEELLLEYGDAYADNGRYEDALRVYDIALEDENPLELNFLISKAETLHNLERYEDAIEIYDRIIDEWEGMEHFSNVRQDSIDALNAKIIKGGPDAQEI
jgi:tetratricopeptide (TPR) repeat protein